MLRHDRGAANKSSPYAARKRLGEKGSLPKSAGVFRRGRVGLQQNMLQTVTSVERYRTESFRRSIPERMRLRMRAVFFR